MNVLRRLAGLVSYNLAWKMAALFASTALWVAINGSEPNADRYLRLGVSTFGLAKRLVIAERVVGTVEVQLRGPRSILRTINEEAHRVTLDLRGVRAGTKAIKVTPEMLNLPRRIQVVRISPPLIDLRIDRLAKKTVPVRAMLVPAERNGYTIFNVTVTPPSVEVSGPQERIQRVQLVETEAVSTLDATGYAEREAGLAGAGEWLTLYPETVRVGFAVREIEGRRTFGTMPVVVRDAGGVARITPPTVTVAVRGPQRRLAYFQLDEEAAYVEADGLEPGHHDLPVQVSVPEGFHVERVSPAVVRVAIEAAAAEETQDAGDETGDEESSGDGEADVKADGKADEEEPAPGAPTG